MKKLFEKNEVTFAVVMIVVYVVGSSIMQGISEGIGLQYSAEMIFHIVMSAVLFGFIRKNGLMKYLGLCRSEVSASKMWFYIPLILVPIMPLFMGVGMQYSAAETIFHTISMLCVGFLEEIIFRGLLFNGICKSSVTRAIVISSVTFGIGHIVNLLNGHDISQNLIQVIYAVCVGFLLVFVFQRTGSLIMCIAFHSLNNCLTAFASTSWGDTGAANIAMLAVRMLIMIVYMVYVIKCIPKRGGQ